jgi:hypothetical protein
MNSTKQKGRRAETAASDSPSPIGGRCSICGRKLPAGNRAGSCPVCLLRIALDPDYNANRLANEGTLAEPRIGAAEANPRTFGHYEIQTRPDGSLHELGHGAMGITFKAIDLNLRIPVTLKVLNLRSFQEALARRRFLREARAAARVRHPNVASVYHLSASGREIFYAMEFVEGESLEYLIKRSGRLEVKLALEIATQVAAGLAAVHKEHLVHRDIKPSNIIVCSEPGGIATAKIIDLGLVKAIDETHFETANSIPGAFAGTPGFASPEQFAGVGVDIRSDLYSLGTTLWMMLTGRAPFTGSPAEVMYQHQHARLPLEQLEGLPQPVIALLGVFLEKDPSRRFQSPTELLETIPTITAAVGARRRITRQSLRKTRPAASGAATRKGPEKPGPKKVSIARLPITGSDVFGREEEIAFLDAAWANRQLNVVTIVAWAGVGKSTLVNHWLGRIATDHYRSAELVFGWSFYRQGTSADTSSADEFFDTALAWFGDADPRIGTEWEKGERLAKLIAHRRTLLILDGLEPLQNPPGPQEGRLRETALQALLRELAAFNTGLCVITTRLPVADIAHHERTTAVRRDLDHLSSDAGARLLRALGVKGNEAELRNASNEFRGHCLALTLLGGYLTDAYQGDIRCRKEITERLAHDVRQGAHARKVMDSYQSWLGEGPELSVLRILGLFDRPADEKALGTLLKPPAIPGLTESLTDLSVTEWRTILAKLRRAKLLAREDQHNPGYLDTHPLVREYFGEQLRNQTIGAWRECNQRLYDHYRMLAPRLPNNFKEMEPLFLAVICGCKAGLFRQALNEVYVPRIQRGNASFAANVLGVRRALLSVLMHFFEGGRLGSFVQIGVEGQSLTAEDELFVLIQAGLLLTATRGLGAPEARICYERAEPLCHFLNRPPLLYLALLGQWRYSFMTDKLSAALQLANRVYSLAQQLNYPALMIGACRTFAFTLTFLGDFEMARQYAHRGVKIWRSGVVESPIEEVNAPALSCLIFEAFCGWHFGEVDFCHATIAEAISIARERNDMHGLAVALLLATILAQLERNPARTEGLAAQLIEVSMRQNFEVWLASGAILRGWARTASSKTAEGISCIEDGIRDYRTTGSILCVPYCLAMKAEALHLADRTSEALEAIGEAEALTEMNEERWCAAELHRLRGVFLAALGAAEAEIEVSFRAAIRIAQEQKSISLANRAKASYAEYRRQKRATAI